jgi:hypothetical protein
LRIAEFSVIRPRIRTVPGLARVASVAGMKIHIVVPNNVLVFASLVTLAVAALGVIVAIG